MSQIDEQEWNSVLQVEYPFLKYGFLWALESTGATVKSSGWQPQHLTVYRGSVLVAFLPLYLKYHSYGEYVFDWSWAEAYERNGQTYYPKLLSCVPYTPATGPRLCIASSEDKDLITTYVIESLLAHARAIKVSSIHVLFPEKALNQRLQESGLSSRLGTQFHWFNQDYESFGGFLETFSSRKRKNVRKERKNVEKQGVQFRVLEGESIDASMWKTFYSFYQRTYLKRSGHGGYLSQAFFEAVAEAIPSQLVMVVAFDGDGEGAGDSEVEEPIAAALYFRDQDTLYGRYWGCQKDVEFLHFETCY
ncbi:MAG: GNAT family N-acetyltransferase, partial [Moraxellaceae bacterium]